MDSKTPHKPQPKRKPIWQRLLRGLGWGGGIIALVVVLLIGFIHTSWGKDMIRGRIESRLGARIDGELTIAALDYSFLFSDLTVSGLEIRPRRGGPPIAVNRLFASLDRASILRGAPVLERLEIDGVRVHIDKRSDGTSNLSHLLFPSEPKKRHITIRSLVVTDASLSLRKPDLTQIEVSNLALEGELDINSQSGERQFDCRAIHASVTVVKADGTTLELPDIETAVHAELNRDRLAATLAGFEIKTVVKQPGQAVIHPRLAIGDVSISLQGVRQEGSWQKGRVAFSVDGLTIGPVSLVKLAANSAFANERLVGEQVVELEGVLISHHQVTELIGRPLLLSDIAADVSIVGPAEKLVVAGGIQTDGGNLTLGGEVDASTLRQPVFDLHVDGTDIDTAKLVVQDPSSRQLRSNFRLSATGTGIPRQPGSFANINVSVHESTIHAGDLAGRQLELENMDAAVRLDDRAVRVQRFNLNALGLTIEADGSIAQDQTFNGQLTIDGNLHRAVAQLRRLGVPIRRLAAPLPKSIHLTARAKGSLDGRLNVELDPSTIPLAGGRVRVSGQGVLARGANGEMKLLEATVRARLRHVDIGQAATLAQRQTSLAGHLSGSVDVRVRGTRRQLGFDLRAELTRQRAIVGVKGTLSHSSVTLDVQARRRSDNAELAHLSARLPLSSRRGKRVLATEREFTATLEVPSRTFAEFKEHLGAHLGATVAAKMDARVNHGTLSAQVRLHGTLANPVGSFKLTGTAALAKLPSHPVTVNLNTSIGLAENGRLGQRIVLRPAASVLVDELEGPLVMAGGTVELPPLFRNGRLDRATLRQGVLALQVEVPKRALASLTPLLTPGSAKTSAFPGSIDGAISLRGPLAAPRFDAMVNWTGFTAANGKPSALTLTMDNQPKHHLGHNNSLNKVTERALDHSPNRVHSLKHFQAKLELGIAHQATLVADVSRHKNLIDVDIQTRAERVALIELLPKRASEQGFKLDLELDYGVLHSDFGATLQVLTDGSTRRLSTVTTRGALTIDGASVNLPGASRVIRDIGVRIDGTGDEVSLSLAAHETDEQKKDRSLSILATIPTVMNADHSSWQKSLAATVKARDWLVFGGSMGPADAPKASLSADIDVAADLAKDIPDIVVTINSMTFSEPERFVRDHGLVALAVGGDMLFVDDPGVRMGKLAPPRDPSLPPAERRKRMPMNIRLDIPQPIRLTKAPIDVEVSGALDIVVSENGVSPQGVLHVHRGMIGLFGHPHAYAGGDLRFDAENPSGALSLVFARGLPPAVLRQLSRASGSQSVRIRIAGSVSQREISLEGAGNSGLLEVMSSHNAGRSLRMTEPGLPSSNSVQLPRGEQPLVLTYLATNLPHLLLLDRFSAWNDPYRPGSGYGRVDHFFGERTTTDGRGRVRVVARPQQIGRSGVEVQLDRLLINTASTLVGAGVRAGSRLGGGIALFVEWSSDD